MLLLPSLRSTGARHYIIVWNSYASC
jgi:hypothetical protein